MDRRRLTSKHALIGAGLGVGALVLGFVAYRVQIDNIPLTTPARASASVAAGWTFVAAGLVAWARRPANRLGWLMVATGFALLAHQLRYSHDALAFTTFFLLGELAYALFVHTALAYPTGSVTGRVERRFVQVAYALALAFPLTLLLVYDGDARLRYLDPQPRESLLRIADAPGLVDVVQKAYAVVGYGVMATLFVALIVRKLVLATPRARRILAPLLVAATAAALRAILDSVLTFATPPPELVEDNLFWWQVAAVIAVPIALLVGLLRARLARLTVAGLVVDLEDTPPSGIRDALARALDDPTLEVAFWLPERRVYADANGRPVHLPVDDARRAVTPLEHDGEPIAAILHDASLADEPKLVAAAGAAARLALENARLNAEVQSQLAKVKESRARIVAAGDEQRRRVERDLHDGAQQRLVALALQLRRAQRQLGVDADPELERVLSSAAEELQVAVQELRDLAAGILPPVLAQSGLAVALDALAGRAPLPVSVDGVPERLPPQVEVTAYFVASEALANVVKHAHASRAAITARRSNGTLTIEVADDGVGGAHPNGGTGLRGLADRVEALGGKLAVESPPGNGTRVIGVLPCAS